MTSTCGEWASVWPTGVAAVTETATGLVGCCSPKKRPIDDSAVAVPYHLSASHLLETLHQARQRHLTLA